MKKIYSYFELCGKLNKDLQIVFLSFSLSTSETKICKFVLKQLLISATNLGLESEALGIPDDEFVPVADQTTEVTVNGFDDMLQSNEGYQENLGNDGSYFKKYCLIYYANCFRKFH